jgi:hypothetical protein
MLKAPRLSRSTPTWRRNTGATSGERAPNEFLRSAVARKPPCRLWVKSRRFDSGPLTSGLPRSADIANRKHQVRKVPGTDMAADDRITAKADRNEVAEQRSQCRS